LKLYLWSRSRLKQGNRQCDLTRHDIRVGEVYPSLTDRRKRVSKKMIEDFRPRVRRYFKWAFFATIAGPLSIVLHEIGHAMMALAVGYSMIRIRFHSVDRIAPADIQPWERALTSEAGSIASLVIVLLCCLIIQNRRHSIFAKAMGMVAAVQFTGGLIYVVSAVFGAVPPTNFDGARFAQYLNIPIFFPALVESLLLICSWIYIIGFINSSERKMAVLGVISGGALGIVIWLTLLGPFLLP